MSSIFKRRKLNRHEFSSSWSPFTVKQGWFTWFITLYLKYHSKLCFCYSLTSHQNALSNCWGPAWGTPPMAKVMRKEARHTQRRDRASGVPRKSSSIYPHNQSLPTLLLCTLPYTSDFMGGCPPPPLSEKELT